MSITQATRRILSGDPLRIEADVPDVLKDEGVTDWYMAQPEDWLYDDAQMEYKAARAAALAQPSVKRVAHLPVSDEFRAQQEQFLADANETIAELEGKEERTADEEYNLMSLRDLVQYVLKPDEMTRAEELANERARKARDAYLLPRLLCDKEGNALFDVEAESGARRWAQVPRRLRYGVLQLYLNTVLSDVRAAKNSGGGEDTPRE